MGDDLRDLLDTDRDRRYPEDLRAILRVLDALALYGYVWGRLSSLAPLPAGRPLTREVLGMCRRGGNERQRGGAQH